MGDLSRPPTATKLDIRISRFSHHLSRLSLSLTFKIHHLLQPLNALFFTTIYSRQTQISAKKKCMSQPSSRLPLQQQQTPSPYQWRACNIIRTKQHRHFPSLLAKSSLVSVTLLQIRLVVVWVSMRKHMLKAWTAAPP